MAKPLDRTRLIKLCGMMTSSHDGEALAATRLACKLIKEAGMNWEAVLSQANGHATAALEPGGVRWRRFAGTYPREAEWLQVCAQDNEFFASLYAWVRKRGYLTDAQMAALRRDMH